MRAIRGLAAGLLLLTWQTAWAGPALPAGPATVPFRLDHNRLIIDAEIQQADGRWRPARLWVDTGNPDFMVNPASVARLGFGPAPPSAGASPDAPVALAPPGGLRVGGVAIDVRGVTPAARTAARIWGALPADANLPATVLRRYRVIVDYPNRTLTLAPPGGSAPRGVRVAAAVHPATGIVQIDGRVGDVAVSLALDLGASYSFVSQSWLERLAAGHPGWRRITGAAGAANIWGLWPGEAEWPVVRVPAIECGGVTLRGVGVAGLPDFFGGASLAAWYSQKTARPVEGFLGPNALQPFRVEIDYAGGAVYFDRAGAAEPPPDMDLVGLTLGPAEGGRWRVLGVVRQEGRAVVDGIEPGDILAAVDGTAVTGATMGRAVDALRGEAGAPRRLTIERGGRSLTVVGHVRRLLGDAGAGTPAPEPGTWRTVLGETRTARESHLFLTGLMESAGVPTLSVAVVQDGRIVFDRMLGSVDPKGGRPAGSDTVLRAASLSKPVFSYLVMRLVDEGVLGLDAPLTALVRPAFTTWPAYASLAGDPRHARLTPAILLSHASGFVNWRRPRETGTLSIGFEPGSQFSYSGEGYYLLQAALEKKTGLGLGELARTKVFGPLGMANSSFLWEPRFDGRLAVDLASDLGPLIRRTRTLPNAAGSLLTNAVDYAAFVVAAMEGRGLTPATAQAWRTPRLRVTGRALHDLTPPAASANDAIQLSWTPGWGWFRSPAGPALFHLGMEEGCESYVVFFPERRTGIVIQSVSGLRTSVSPAIVKQLIGDAWSPFAWMRY